MCKKKQPLKYIGIIRLFFLPKTNKVLKFVSTRENMSAKSNFSLLCQLV